MKLLFDAIFWLHLPAALSCIPAFWVASLTKKGGRVHVSAGRWFVYGMYLVAFTGTVMGILIFLDPLSRVPQAATWSAAAQAKESAIRRDLGVFLLYLGAITFWPVYHGLRSIRSRRDPGSIATPLHRALALLPGAASMLAILYAAFVAVGPVLLLAMSPIGLALTALARHYLKDPLRDPKGWWFQHMTSMLAGGIAVHTAFAVFFLGRMMGMVLPGLLQLLPWVLPTLVGVPAIVILVRRDRRRFRTGRAAGLPIDA